MNRMHLVAIIITASVFAIGVASAQDTAPASSVYCPSLSQTLSYGMRDSQTNPMGQVTELQKFLSEYYDLNPDEYVTGFFGRKTRDNVRKFQCEKMSICSGDEASTGWGVVGPKTRTAIKNACGSSTTNTYSQSTYYAQATYTTTTYSQSSYTANLSCTLDGVTVLHTQSRTFYSSRTSADCASIALARTCTNGTLSGATSYQYASCTTEQAAAACSFNGQTIAHNAGVTAYQSATVPHGQTCQSQTRTCTNGTLSGSYGYTTCAVQPPPVVANIPTCTYKGQSYAEGATGPEAFPLTEVPWITPLCDNGVWVNQRGANICDFRAQSSDDGWRTHYTCGAYSRKAYLGVTPRHGKASLSLTVETTAAYCVMYTRTLSWGDGSPPISYSARGCADDVPGGTFTHTYVSPGSYTITLQNAYSYPETLTNSATIRVDP